MKDYKLVNNMYDVELDNGAIKRVDKAYIDNSMKSLDITELDAIQMWIEDEGFEINEEQEELNQKAKDNRITASIHKASSGKGTRTRKVERKANPDKEALIAGLANYLTGLGDLVTDCRIENIGKIITFKYNGKEMKLDLVERRVSKKGV